MAANREKPIVLRDLSHLGTTTLPVRPKQHVCEQPKTQQQSAALPRVTPIIKEHIKELLEYPYVGVLTEWGAGYGFIGPSIKGIIAHISCLRPQPKHGINPCRAGVTCCYAEGVSPVRYKKQGKSNPTAIRWRILEGVGVDQEKLNLDRRKHLATCPLHHIQEALAAKWYRDAWGGHPQFGLRDEVLLEETCKRLGVLLNDPPEFIQLLLALDQSPQALTLAQKDIWIVEHISASVPKELALPPSTAWATFQSLRDPLRDRYMPILARCVALPTADTEASAFRSFADALSPSVREQLVSRLCAAGVDFSCAQALFPYLSRKQLRDAFSRHAVGLDLESDGTRVFQIACHDGQIALGPPMQKEGMPVESLEKICHVFNETFPDFWVVGHNVIAWDLPVLRKLAPRSTWGSRKTRVWDTLLVSWYLEPWRRSHALIGSNRAHDAGEDALAALNLFRQQVEAIDIDFSLLIQDSNAIPAQLWNLATADGSKRKFRHPPSWLPIQPSQTQPEQFLIPEHQLNDLAWVPGVAYIWPSGYADPLDREISLEKITSAAKAWPDDAHIGLLVTVLTEAISNNVRVRLRMIPVWLREYNAEILDNCSEWPTQAEVKGAKWLVSSYEALRSAKEDEMSTWLSRCHCLFPDYAKLVLLRCRNELENEKIMQMLEMEASEAQGGFLVRVNDRSKVRKLLGAPPPDKACYWLEHIPTQHTSSRLWRFWELPAAAAQLKIDAASELPDRSEAPCHCVVPVFIDSETYGPATSDVLWPSSSDRYEYWQDTLTRLHSLILNTPSKIAVAFFTKHQSERELLAGVLSAFYDVPDISANPLDQFRRKPTSKRRVFLADIGSAAWFSDCAERFGVELMSVVEELPIHEWWMACEDYLNPDIAIDDPGSESEGSEDPEHAEGENDSVTDESGNDVSAREYISVDGLQPALRRILPAWIQSVFAVASRVVILDARLNLLPSNMGEAFTRPKVPITAFPESLSGALTGIRDDLGTILRCDPPRTVQEYTDFLVRHWNRDKKPNDKPIDDFYDFQKPIIETITNSPETDILVRLPTGAGKSVLFQVPALLHGHRTQRLSIVVSPLRALMRDQVMRLWKLGFFQSVDYLSGDREAWENAEVHQGIIDHRIKLLYVAPERFRNARFREALQRRNQSDSGLEFVVVDEAHCVSQWGYEFRPDYFYAAGEICRSFRGNGHVSRALLFSATVTSVVGQDLMRVFIPEGSNRKLLSCPSESRHPIQDFISLHSEEVPNPLYGDNSESKVTARGDQIAEVIKKANPDKSIVIVFVTRRAHAERLAGYLQDNLPDKFRTASFHAGLPSSVRLQVYDKVKLGDINVLVATKAFGMGMDIPNIHWCVHLAPPSFIEDYLQEVGRTGRDEKRRKEAGLKSVQCTLLYNQGDIARNIELTISSMIKPPLLDAVWKAIMERSFLSEAKTRLCILPSHAIDGVKADMLNRALGWLEKAPCSRIAILGFLPNIIKVSGIKRASLEKVAKGDTQEAIVAQALLRLFNDPEPPEIKANKSEEPPPKAKSFFTVVANVVGFLFRGNQQSVAVQPTAPQTAPALVQNKGQEFSAELNLGAILRTSGLDSVDDIYRGLFTLQKLDGLHIDRVLHFTEESNLECADKMWTWLAAMTKFLAQPAERPRTVDPEELQRLAEIEKEDELSPRQKREWETRQRTCARAAVRLCNAAGMRIKEALNEANDLVYVYSLPGDSTVRVKRRVDRFVRLAKSFITTIRHNGGNTLDLAEVIELMGEKGTLRDATKTMQLMATLGLYSSNESLVPFSHIVRVDVEEPLLGPQQEKVREADAKMYADLERVNRLSELRAFAMEVFTGIKDEKARSHFIDEYFDAASPEALLSILERVGADLGNSEIGKKIRRDAMEKALGQLRDGEEPNQYAACATDWNHNLLVNAGPGAGKTLVLMMRAAHLIHAQGLSPENVLILSFNRAVVHEIRRRITLLFDDLGYGGYVRRLQVNTFHAYSLRHLPREQGSTLASHFTRFVNKCEQDVVFCRDVARGLKAILIDEFQDMDGERMRLLRVLSKTSQAGVMVIGDDDQDILRWNRDDHSEASELFTEFRQAYENTQNIVLKKNFRSGQRIVEHTQRFICEHMPDESHRELATVTLSHAKGKTRQGEVITDFNPTALEDEVARLRLTNGVKTVAVLSRTNGDAAVIYERLKARFPGTSLQGGDNLPLRSLRHVACWLDACSTRLATHGNEFLEKELLKSVRSLYRTSCIPEAAGQGKHKDYVYVNLLWDELLAENRAATLKDHIDQLMDMDLDSYGRLLFQTTLDHWVKLRNELWGGESQVVVSTIHKVKGLEFDAVVIMPSNASFPFNRDPITYQDSADEVRLFYVGMTRAKSHLIYSFGPREQAWLSQTRHQSNVIATRLVGSLEEVKIGFPALAALNCQVYIHSHVAPGDKVQVRPTNAGGVLIRHGADNRPIAMLSNGYEVDFKKAEVNIHSVVRHDVGDDERFPVADMSAIVQERRWYYTVTVSGKIL